MHDVQSQLFKMDDATDWVARRTMAVRAPRAGDGPAGSDGNSLRAQIGDSSYETVEVCRKERRQMTADK